MTGTGSAGHRYQTSERQTERSACARGKTAQRAEEGDKHRSAWWEGIFASFSITPTLWEKLFQGPVDRNMLEDSACNLRTETPGSPPKTKKVRGWPFQARPRLLQISAESPTFSHSTYSLESSFRRKPSRSYSEKEEQKMSLRTSLCYLCGHIPRATP